MADEPKKLSGPTVHLKESEATFKLGEEPNGQILVVEVQPGTLIRNRFCVLGTLSQEGAQADVFLCSDDDENGKKVAFKLYRKGKAKEAVIAQLLLVKHKDILCLLDANTWNGLPYEVWEYAEGGSLDRYIPISEAELRNNILPEVLNGLEYLHDRKIIHRDIKPSNLFYRKPNRQDVAIGDFGMASQLKEGSIERSHIGGTIAYMAPEAFTGQYSKETDYYALGMTLLVLSQKSSSLTDMHLYEHVAIPENLSDDFRLLLRGLLTKERSERWTASHIERWRRGEKVKVYSDTLKDSGLEPWKVAEDTVVHTLSDLAAILEERSDLATEMVGHGDISKHIFVLQRDYAKHVRIRKVEEGTSPLPLKVLEVVYILDDGRPYRLMSQARATACEELAVLIDRDSHHWALGREHLFSGRIPLWLRYYRGGEAEAIANQWQSVVSDYRTKQDQGLEYFLHLLNPSLSKPKIEVSPSELNLGRVEAGSIVTKTLTIKNSGRGHLGGRVRLENDIQGVAIRPEIFDGNLNDITVTFDPSNFPVGRRAKGDILIESNADETTLRVPLRLRVGYPILSNIVQFLRGGLRGLYDLLLRHGIVSFMIAAGGCYVLLPYVAPYFVDPFGDGGITTKLVWHPTGELAPYLSAAWSFFVMVVGFVCLGLGTLNRGYLLPVAVGLLAFLRMRRKIRREKTNVEKARGKSVFLLLVVLSFLLYPAVKPVIMREYYRLRGQGENSVDEFHGKRGVITGDKVRLRAGPSRQAPLLKTLRVNTVIDVMEPATNGFSRVRLPDGTEGFVDSRYVNVE